MDSLCPRRARLLIAGACLVWAAGCVGSIEGTESSEEASAGGERMTWNGMLQSAGHLAAGAVLVEGPESSGAGLDGTADFQVVRISTCHAGELDFFGAALAQVNQSYNADGVQQNAALDLKATLEADSGEKLAAVPLNYAELAAGAKTCGVRQQTTFARQFSFHLSQTLIARGSFPVSLFVCIDTNGNDSCADEQASALPEAVVPGLEVKNRVFSHLALEIAISEGKATLQWPANPEADNVYNQLAKNMADMLKNLETDKQGPIGLVLAMQTQDQTCQYQADKRFNGCFVAGTHVSIDGGLLAPIESISKATGVLTAAGTLTSPVRIVKGPEHKPVIAIRTLGGHELTVTQDHPMVTPEGIKPARKLTVKDQLVTATGGLTRIASLERIPYSGMVYNLALPGTERADHLIVAEGLLTGDLYLQNMLAARKR